jgi:hypothetical protein
MSRRSTIRRVGAASVDLKALDRAIERNRAERGALGLARGGETLDVLYPVEVAPTGPMAPPAFWRRPAREGYDSPRLAQVVRAGGRALG